MSIREIKNIINFKADKMMRQGDLRSDATPDLRGIVNRNFLTGRINKITKGKK